MSKKIIITGANSYIGTYFEKWLSKYPGQYSIETVDMLDKNWHEKPFEGCTAVFHVAGIAHVSSDPKLKSMYYRVNRDMTIEAAKKAKTEKVKQFIFMSSIIVYGGKCKEITEETEPQPDNFYGDSKLEAEKGIMRLCDDAFMVVVIRSPMVYGQGCKGNYLQLSGIARKTPFFPNIDNKRSMLYISNLCEFVRLMVDNGEKGIFYPQNKEYVKTLDMVRLIAQAHGKKILTSRWLNWAVKLCGIIPGRIGELANKAFGSLYYNIEMSSYKTDYRVVGLQDSIIEAEQGAAGMVDNTQ